MNTLIIAFQLLVCLTCLLAAIIITWGPATLNYFNKIRPERRIKRISLSVLLWIAFLITLISFAVPLAAFFGSCFAFLSSVFIALIVVPVKVSRLWTLPLFMAVSAFSLMIVQPLGLKVLCLPQADNLPYKPVASHVIKTYSEGFGFEGIAVGQDGTLYLSGNSFLDFSRGDYYHHAQGMLIARKTDGTEQIIFRTPEGVTSGVPVVAQDNSIYLTSHGSKSFIWHIDTHSQVRQLAQFPANAWPNGLDIGPDGMLYTPDSFLGVIWRVNPSNGQIEVAVRDNALLARPFISLAPGANGLHFKGHDMIVTVSDKTTLLRYTMNNNNQFESASVVARGIPGDDFAVGSDGSFFITTHPYNSLVRVSPGGERTMIANKEQYIIGATDAAFGRVASDYHTLYVVTDGGAFTDGPKARGQLIALLPYASQ